jgi:C-terminal processing protease CtpA/Prc
MQKHNRALIAGTETGGSRVLLAGGNNYFEAPNTQLQVLKATNRYVINTKEAATGQGVQPDLLSKAKPEHVINNTDVVLEDIIMMFLEK